MEEDRPEEPAEPTEPEKPTEPAEPTEPTEPAEPAEPVERPAPPVERPAPKPRVVRLRKPKSTPPSVALPEIDDKFWANLLRTQREAERATKLQHISEFNLL